MHVVYLPIMFYTLGLFLSKINKFDIQFIMYANIYFFFLITLYLQDDWFFHIWFESYLLNILTLKSINSNNIISFLFC